MHLWLEVRGRGFGALFYYKAVFRFVLLQSFFGVVFNLSVWGEVDKHLLMF